MDNALESKFVDPPEDHAARDFVRRARSGDATAVETIANTYRSTLEAVARGHGVPPTDAEDLIQTSYQRLLRRENEVRNVAGVLRWTMENLCRNYHRDAARERQGLQRYSRESRRSPSPAAAMELRFVHALDVKTALAHIGRPCFAIITALVLRDRESTAVCAGPAAAVTPTSSISCTGQAARRGGPSMPLNVPTSSATATRRSSSRGSRR